jgi:hypothetical protein
MTILSEKNIRQRSVALVISLVGKKMSDRWWLSRNKAFGNISPALQWIRDPEVVYDYLMSHSSGEYF